MRLRSCVVRRCTIASVDLPAERTKNGRPHIVPLSDIAYQVIEPHLGRDWLFGRRGTGFSGWSKEKKLLDAQRKIPAWQLRDIRRTVATGMAELGVEPHIVEACLNHVSGHKAGVAGIYNKATYLPPKTAALSLWENHVAPRSWRRRRALTSVGCVQSVSRDGEEAYPWLHRTVRGWPVSSAQLVWRDPNRRSDAMVYMRIAYDKGDLRGDWKPATHPARVRCTRATSASSPSSCWKRERSAANAAPRRTERPRATGRGDVPGEESRRACTQQRCSLAPEVLKGRSMQQASAVRSIERVHAEVIPPDVDTFTGFASRTFSRDTT